MDKKNEHEQTTHKNEQSDWVNEDESLGEQSYECSHEHSYECSHEHSDDQSHSAGFSTDYRTLNSKLLKEVGEKNTEIERLNKELHDEKRDFQIALVQYSERVKKEIALKVSDALQNLSVKAIFPIISNIQNTAKSISKVNENLGKGLSMCISQMVQALESQGFRKIEVVIGQKFDANLHSAIDSAESDGEEDIILESYSDAWEYSGRIIQHASVLVSKKPD